MSVVIISTYKVVLSIQRAIGLSARGRLVCYSTSSPRTRRKTFRRIVVVRAAGLGNLDLGWSESFRGAGRHRSRHFDGLRGTLEECRWLLSSSREGTNRFSDGDVMCV
jgi:hypothetical protein